MVELLRNWIYQFQRLWAVNRRQTCNINEARHQYEIIRSSANVHSHRILLQPIQSTRIRIPATGGSIMVSLTSANSAYRVCCCMAIQYQCDGCLLAVCGCLLPLLLKFESRDSCTNSYVEKSRHQKFTLHTSFISCLLLNSITKAQASTTPSIPCYRRV